MSLDLVPVPGVYQQRQVAARSQERPRREEAEEVLRVAQDRLDQMRLQPRREDPQDTGEWRTLINWQRIEAAAH